MTAKKKTGPLTRRATQAKGAPIPAELPQRPKRRAADVSVREAYLAAKAPPSPCTSKGTPASCITALPTQALSHLQQHDKLCKRVVAAPTALWPSAENEPHSEVTDEFASPKHRRILHVRRPAGRVRKPSSLTPPQTPSGPSNSPTVRTTPDSSFSDSQSYKYPALAAVVLLDKYSSMPIRRPSQAATQPQPQPLPAHRGKRKCKDETGPAPVDYLAYTKKRRILDAFAREQFSAGVGCGRDLPDCDLPLKKRRCFRTVVTTVTEVEYTMSCE